ncbi:MAG: hypothetical protein GY863_01340 [bacterium]|nr:hypothetical protein [bacterium]
MGTKEQQKKKAVGLVSGGLDSSLAVRIIADLGFEVTAINVESSFFAGLLKEGDCESSDPSNRNINYVTFWGGDDFIDLVKNPKYGYGKHMNMCIDCKVFMLRHAKKVMEEIGAEFVFTGEVVGQRPMSQQRDTLRRIERETGLEGRLLRPLSAKVLEPTLPEQSGIIDRDKLYDFNGRNRKPQMKLAEELGITEYPSPAGGCILTEEDYSIKLRDAFDHGEDSNLHMQNLKQGRHFRMVDGSKILCGRTNEENEYFFSVISDDVSVFTVKGFSSTYCFLYGEPSETNMKIAGSLAARYSKAKHLNRVEIKWWTGKEEDNPGKFEAEPASDELLKEYRIGRG